MFGTLRFAGKRAATTVGSMAAEIPVFSPLPRPPMLVARLQKAMGCGQLPKRRRLMLYVMLLFVLCYLSYELDAHRKAEAAARLAQQQHRNGAFSPSFHSRAPRGAPEPAYSASLSTHAKAGHSNSNASTEHGPSSHINGKSPPLAPSLPSIPPSEKIDRASSTGITSSVPEPPSQYVIAEEVRQLLDQVAMEQHPSGDDEGERTGSGLESDSVNGLVSGSGDAQAVGGSTDGLRPVLAFRFAWRPILDDDENLAALQMDPSNENLHEILHEKIVLSQTQLMRTIAAAGFDPRRARRKDSLSGGDGADTESGDNAIGGLESAGDDGLDTSDPVFKFGALAVQSALEDEYEALLLDALALQVFHGDCDAAEVSSASALFKTDADLAVEDMDHDGPIWGAWCVLRGMRISHAAQHYFALIERARCRMQQLVHGLQAYQQNEAKDHDDSASQPAMNLKMWLVENVEVQKPAVRDGSEVVEDDEDEGDDEEPEELLGIRERASYKGIEAGPEKLMANAMYMQARYGDCRLYAPPSSGIGMVFPVARAKLEVTSKSTENCGRFVGPNRVQNVTVAPSEDEAESTTYSGAAESPKKGNADERSAVGEGALGVWTNESQEEETERMRKSAPAKRVPRSMHLGAIRGHSLWGAWCLLDGVSTSYARNELARYIESLESVIQMDNGLQSESSGSND